MAARGQGAFALPLPRPRVSCAADGQGPTRKEGGEVHTEGAPSAAPAQALPPTQLLGQQLLFDPPDCSQNVPSGL